MANAPRDDNSIPTLLAVSNVDGVTPVVLWADPTTHRLLVDSSGGLSGTINEIAYFNSSSTIASLAVATYPSLTELSYVKGVSSAIQTQMNLKAPLASPTFTTQIITPLVIGGTTTTSDLNLKTTSGIGATGADMHFLVGNNGATEAMTILNDGKVGIGTAAPGATLEVYQPSSGTVGILLSGNTPSAGDTANANGVIFTLGYNATNNRQLWLTDSAQYGNAAYNSFRYILGWDIPSIDAVNNTGVLRKNINLGFTDINIGVGFDITTATQSSIAAKLHILGSGTSTGLALRVDDSGGNVKVVIQDNGNVGIGQTTPTAVLHLKAGTATASTAPLKFTSGTLLAAAEAGAIEFLTDDFYGTITTGAARKKFYIEGGTDVAFADGGTGISSWTQYLIPYAATTTSIGQIAIGTSGQVLTSNGAGAAPTFQAAAGGSELLRAYANANEGILAGTFEDVPFNTEVFDTGNNFNTTTFTYTCPSAGKYMVIVAVLIDVTAAGDQLLLQIQKNGAVTAQGEVVAATTTREQISVSDLVNCAQNDTLKAQIRNSNNNDTILLGSDATYIIIYKVA